MILRVSTRVACAAFLALDFALLVAFAVGVGSGCVIWDRIAVPNDQLVRPTIPADSPALPPAKGPSAASD